MKMKKIRSVLGILLISMVVAGCGSDNKSGGESSSTLYGSANSSVVDSNEGNVTRATSLTEFREYVRLGKFYKVSQASSNYCNGGYIKLSYKKLNRNCTVVTSKSDFLFWDDVITNVSNECTTTSSKIITESTKTGTLTNGYGSSKTDTINKLLSLIDNSDSINFAYSGNGYNMYRVVIEKDSKVYHIDLTYPIALNPVLIQNETSTTSSNGEVADPSFLNFNCQI